MKAVYKLIAIASLCLVVGCTTINSSKQTVQIHYSSSVGFASFANNTEVPQAASRAVNVASGVLRSKGLNDIFVYQSKTSCNQLVVCPNANPSLGEFLRWAQENNLDLLITGSVNEWEYKVGLDGEPVAAVSLQLYDVSSGAMIWSSVGSKIGTTHAGLANTAQALIRDMFYSLKIY